MSKSPVHPNYETSEYGCYEFDLSYGNESDIHEYPNLQSELSCLFDHRLNFSQFLEEARQHEGDMNINFQRSSSCSNHVGKIKLGGHKRNKKSWKIPLFSWWKFDRKNKSGSDPIHVANVSKPAKGCGSGPLCGTTRGTDPPCRRHASSGPVSILFNPTKVVENEVPYTVSLEQPNDPYQINAYGPVYLVT